MATHTRSPHPALAAGLLLLAGPTILSAQAAPAPGGVLSLQEVYTLAAERNPGVQAAQAATRAAAAQEASARLPPDPQLQIGVMNASLPGLSANMPTSMAPSIQVMQMVPTPGKLGLSGRLARQGTAIARAEADERWWEVRSRAAMAFHELYSADRQLAVMRETVVLLQSFEQVAKAMYAAGTGRQSDVLRGSVEVSRMQADLARMRAMRAAAAARLNAVLDRPAETPIPAVAAAAEPGPLPTDSLQAWAERGRPMLVGGRLQLERAQTRSALARRELWPDVTVGVQYGQRAGEMGTERMGSLMLGVTLPVYAGKRQLQMREEAEAMRQMAEADLTDMRAQVNARIAELAAELERARILVRLYRTEVLPQAEATVASTLSSYRVGSVDFMTLVDAQMTLNRYEQELHQLLAEYGTLRAELEMSVGRELPRITTGPTEDR